MKVLVVSNMYSTEENPVGGIFVHEQVKALRRFGVDVRVATGKPLWLSRRPHRAARRVLRELADRRRSFQWTEYDGVPVATFSYFAGGFARPFLRPWFYANSLRRLLPSLAAGFDYDLVHAHTAFLDGRAAAGAARLRNVPLALTEHTGPFSLVTDDRRMRRHTVFAMNAADQIIAVSNALRDEIEGRLPEVDPRKIMVLPNGVDCEFFDPCICPNQAGLATAGTNTKSAEEIPTAHDTETITALWVGHLVEVKRVDRLLDAFAMVAPHVPRPRLRLVGSGVLEAVLKRKAGELQVADKVTFVPTRDRAGVRAEMASADFLVISSEVETFGVVGIEAMAMGLPVVATNCGGPPDYVTGPDIGELVDNSTEGIAAGLRNMAARHSSIDRAKIRRQAVTNFDFGLLARRLGELYSDLVKRRAAGDR